MGLAAKNIGWRHPDAYGHKKTAPVKKAASYRGRCAEIKILLNPGALWQPCWPAPGRDITPSAVVRHGPDPAFLIHLDGDTVACHQ